MSYDSFLVIHLVVFRFQFLFFTLHVDDPLRISQIPYYYHEHGTVAMRCVLASFHVFHGMSFCLCFFFHVL